MVPFALKAAVARSVASLVDLDRRIAQPGRRYIMAYHRVISPERAAADHTHSAMWISPATFEAQLQWLRRVGEIVDYHELLEDETPTHRPRFALTFDDGWLDNYQEASPLLRKYEAPALIFLVTAAVDSGDLFWPEDVVTKTHRYASAGRTACLAALDRLWPVRAPARLLASATPGHAAEAWVEALKLIPEAERNQRISAYFDTIGASASPLQGYLMNWDQVRCMQSAGVSFGSHTHNHRILQGAAMADVAAEVSQSRQIMKDRLGEWPDAFCYPNARYDGREGAVLADAGYKYAFKLDSERLKDPVNRYLIPRFLMSELFARDQDFFRMYLLERPGFVGERNRILVPPASEGRPSAQ